MLVAHTHTHTHTENWYVHVPYSQTLKASYIAELSLGHLSDSAHVSSLTRLDLMGAHFPVKDPLLYTVFCHRLRLARDLGLHSLLSVDMKMVS